ncbi:hypothetical protein NE237_013859 [Protea cynaroides]|uniref:TF-B3 domain-containing protein n=1 Tax=Protea cynaroides TaxID=273540 RepID=A0A9Q0JYZ2_9MAGN|nr:hypothetical protein NE237_013859 [Protea cynaroides]
MTVIKRKRKDRARKEDDDDDHDLSLELKLSRGDPWTVKKKLTESDLNHLSRLILPRDQVEKHVLPFFNPEEEKGVLRSENGFHFRVKDVDEDSSHLLSFKRVKSTRSYKLGLNWISQFVKRRRLQKGDVIGMLWDNYGTRGFYFSVLERADGPPTTTHHATATHHEPLVAPTPPPHLITLYEYARQDLQLRQPIPSEQP